MHKYRVNLRCCENLHQIIPICNNFNLVYNLAGSITINYRNIRDSEIPVSRSLYNLYYIFHLIRCGNQHYFFISSGPMIFLRNKSLEYLSDYNCRNRTNYKSNKHLHTRVIFPHLCKINASGGQYYDISIHLSNSIYFLKQLTIDYIVVSESHKIYYYVYRKLQQKQSKVMLCSVYQTCSKETEFNPIGNQI